MRIANIVATACAALSVFVVGGGAWFVAFSSLIWASTANVAAAYLAGAITGVFFGVLVSAPLAQRLRRLLKP